VTVPYFAAVIALLLAAVTASTAQTTAGYADLVKLFTEWRTFQLPRVIDGVPDYTARAMATQHVELTRWRRRLNDLDFKSWSIPEQVDWHLVRAEMSGLDFDHRVLRPWATNPAFYQTVFGSQSDQPAREGPHAYGNVELWTYNFPLTPERASQLEADLSTIPALLDQAKKNLTGTGRDLWVRGAGTIKEQAGLLDRLQKQVNGTPASLAAAVTRARDATNAFAAWVEKESATKKGSSGIGVANYDWYLKNVQLVSYTWRDEVTLMERELARAHAFLDLEERRNAALPPQQPIASAEEHTRRFDGAITEYMAFLKDRNILTVKPYMEPALRARIGRFNAGPREFFAEVDYRDPEIMRTHGYHWFDLARMQHEPHPSPIRKGPLLYNMFITRTEGHATGWEEMTMQAGMLDARPRSRELIYVLLAQRAARALGDLKMHANELTLEEAARFAVANTPRGWLRLDGRTVWFEQHLYLQQPGYGTSYVIGKIQIEELLAARRKQLGADFTLQRFMDEFDAVGLIPVSLMRWEMTGIPP
jgi:hypothetical protein